MLRSQVIISGHAKQRLAERVPEIPAKNYNSFVSAARYNGVSLKMLTKIEQQNFRRYHRINNSQQVRIYRGYAFIFGGNDHKARTLITVYKYCPQNLTC